MELQVFVNGKPKDVCGVDQETTAEEIVNVLIDSLHLSGSYCLVAYWRKNEIVFSPPESPMNFISRIGDHVKQFQFVLRRSETHRSPHPPRARSPVPSSHHHRRISSGSFQNAATAYNQPHDLGYRRPEDKEVAAAFAEQMSDAEYQQLAAVDWNRKLEEAYSRRKYLIDEGVQLRQRLQMLDVDIQQERNRVQALESEMANGLTTLLNLVEQAVERRRQELMCLTVTPPQPSSSFNSSGANPVCDEVMI